MHPGGYTPEGDDAPLTTLLQEASGAYELGEDAPCRRSVEYKAL